MTIDRAVFASTFFLLWVCSGTNAQEAVCLAEAKAYATSEDVAQLGPLRECIGQIAAADEPILPAFGAPGTPPSMTLEQQNWFKDFLQDRGPSLPGDDFIAVMPDGLVVMAKRMDSGVNFTIEDTYLLFKME